MLSRETGAWSQVDKQEGLHQQEELCSQGREQREALKWRFDHRQVLEKLYRLKWGPLDGLGALVISPTRELALQIFNELRKIGRRHEFSAGLLIGGKNVKEEQERVGGEYPLKNSFCKIAYGEDTG